MTKKKQNSTQKIITRVFIAALILLISYPIILYFIGYITYVWPGIDWRNLYERVAFSRQNSFEARMMEGAKQAYIDKSTEEPFSELADWDNWGMSLVGLRSDGYRLIELEERMYELKPRSEKNIWFDFKLIKPTKNSIQITLNGYLKDLNAGYVLDYDASYSSPYMPVKPTKGTVVNRLDCRTRKINNKNIIEMIVRITDARKSNSKQDNTISPYTISCNLYDLPSGTYYVDYYGRYSLTGMYLLYTEYKDKYPHVSDEEYYFDVITIP